MSEKPDKNTALKTAENQRSFSESALSSKHSFSGHKDNHLIREDKSMSSDRQLMSVKEVAEFLGVSVRTVWEQCAHGVIPQPIKIGKKITRWHRATLEQWLKEKLDCAEKERKKIPEIGKI